MYYSVLLNRLHYSNNLFVSYIPFYFQEGDWNVPHSLALFDESDVLCVADREGERVDCMKAGIERPLYANRDETGQKITSYKRVGRPYAIDAKGKIWNKSSFTTYVI